MLTGKAKEDFLKNQYKESLLKDFDLETVCFIFNVLPLNHQYSDIIEWFDSVGIYIDIGVFPTNKDDSICFSGSFFGILGGWDDDVLHENRQEATEKAIIHANKIYNERQNSRV